MLSAADKNYSIFSDDDFRSGCRTRNTVGVVEPDISHSQEYTHPNDQTTLLNIVLLDKKKSLNKMHMGAIKID